MFSGLLGLHTLVIIVSICPKVNKMYDSYHSNEIKAHVHNLTIVYTQLNHIYST